MFSYLHGGYTYTGRYDGIEIIISYMASPFKTAQINGTAVGVQGDGTSTNLVSVN